MIEIDGEVEMPWGGWSFLQLPAGNACAARYGRWIGVFALLLLFLPVLLQPAEAAKKWRTTKFQVILAIPQIDMRFERGRMAALAAEISEHLVRQVTIDPDELFKMENFLHDAAEYYQDLGFPDPIGSGYLKPLIKSVDGSEFVRVFLFDLEAWNPEAKGLGFYINECDGEKFRAFRGIALSRPKTFKDGKLMELAYANMAHELFHAVQQASNFKKTPGKCRIGKWISEGTADAIGFDVARKLRRLTFPNWNVSESGRPLFAKVWGLRSYSRPLTKPDEQYSGHYLTSSFWRHLAELTYAKKHGRDHPGAGKAPVDYSYMVDLFSKRPNGSGPRFELEWLNDWMHTYADIIDDLDRVYAQFTATIADHMAPGSRIGKIKGLTKQGREERWREALFGPCKPVKIGSKVPWRTIPFDLDFAAARCFEFEVTGGGGGGELIIQQSTLTAGEQRQLRIGLSGGHLVGGPNIQPGAAGTVDEGKSFAIWRFPITFNHKYAFVISNLAGKAEKTTKLKVPLHFTLSSWQTSWSKRAEPPPKQKKKIKTKADVKQRLRETAAKPSRKTALAAMASRLNEPASATCDGNLRAKNVCGPQLKIILMLDDGSIPGQGLIGGSGGPIRQIGAAGELRRGGGAVAPAMSAAERIAGKGNTIDISIPLIGYGIRTKVSNARITVTKGGGGTYHAVRTTPEKHLGYLPNGQVTITENTRHVLQGSFVASLVDAVDAKKATARNPELPVRESIQGSFTIAAPWRGKPGKQSADSGSMRDIRLDMVSFIQKLPPAMRNSMLRGAPLQQLCKMGIDEKQLIALGFIGEQDSKSPCGGTAAAVLQEPVCDCRCKSFDDEYGNKECRQQCRQEWRRQQCRSPDDLELGPMDAETEKFMAEVQALGLPEITNKTYRMTFQKGSPRVRKALWQDIERQKQVRLSRPAKQAGGALDAETMRYKAEMESRGLPAKTVAAGVIMFKSGNAQKRKMLWKMLQQMK